MSLNISQLKSRVAQNAYYRTMSLIYGIQSCAFDYPEAQYQDDIVLIDLLSSGRDCRYLSRGPVHELGKEGFHRRVGPPIIINYGTCVPLPIPNCNSCSKL